jgi:hypothetical protein
MVGSLQGTYLQDGCSMKNVFRVVLEHIVHLTNFQKLQLFSAKGGKLVFLKELAAERTPGAERGDGGAYRNKCKIYVLFRLFKNLGRLGMQGLSRGETCTRMVGVQKCRL